ncbi:MAG: hypothetical protein P1P88_16255, partial [Bacteroidales bacterium]|nr:hypothetical protein [Bacteroidales bacterium]
KINTDSLSVPHPFMHQRRFVLEPLNEIAPDFIHPSLKKPVLNLLLFCNDAMNVKKLTGKDILSSVA